MNSRGHATGRGRFSWCGGASLCRKCLCQNDGKQKTQAKDDPGAVLVADQNSNKNILSIVATPTMPQVPQPASLWLLK